MIDFSLSEEQKAVRASVRAFVADNLIPFETELLRRETAGGPGFLTRDENNELQAKARRSGLWGLDAPEEFGGADLDTVTQVLVREELGRSVIWFDFGGSVAPVLYEADDQQRDQYLKPFLDGNLTYCFGLSEAEAGSDPAAMRTHARRDGEDWIISGEKTWISRGHESDVAIVFAKTEDEHGTGGVSAFLVDRDMGWRSYPIPVMGSQNCATLTFPDVRVPRRNLLGPLNGAFSLALQSINASRACNLPPRAVGAARRMLELAAVHALNRRTFGKALADRENIQWMLAESEAEIRATQALYLHAAWLVDQGRDCRHEASVTKLTAARMVNRVADRVLQIHGAAGYARELPIERFFRDLRVYRIYEGSDEMQLARIARHVLRNPTDVGDLTS